MQRETLESAHTNTNVLTNMGAAAKALKRAHQDLDVDKVHEMMDDIADQEDVAREISEAISNPVAFGQDVDEVNKSNPLLSYILVVLFIFVTWKSRLLECN